MALARKELLSLGEAARTLGMDIDDLLELVYSREVPAMLAPTTERLLLTAADVERLRVRRQTQQAG